MNSTLFKQCVAEFIGTFALIFIGIGAIFNDAGLLGVAFAHGLTIAVMVAAVGGICGAQLNPAVTFGLLVGGFMDVKKSAAYWIAQLLGATVAGFVLIPLLGSVAHVANGTPQLSPMIGVGQGIAIEAILTFFLVFVVYGAAVDTRAPRYGGIAIGLTVTLDILFGGPLTGAAMNPARAFGPALASGTWGNHWVYWVGPLLGGAAAGLVYGRYLIHNHHPK